MREKDADAAARSRLRDPTSLTAIGALSGLAAYGILRAAHDGFYASFGVPAEDVGLDYVSILSRTVSTAAVVGGFALVLGVALSSTALGGLLGQGAIALGERMPGAQQAVWISAVLLVASAFIAALAHDWPLAVWISVGLLGVLAVMRAVVRLLPRLHSAIRTRGYPRGAAFGAVAIALSVTMFALETVGHAWGERVQAGQRREPPLAEFFLTRWPPSVHIESGDRDNSTSYLLLGHDDGVYVLWDMERRQVVRMPTDTTTLRTVSSR